VFDSGGRTADNTDVTDWGALAAATWFESLAVASRPLQRRPRRNNLYSTTKNTKLREISNQAATDAKQRPGFQNRNRGNRIFEIEGKGAMGSAERVGRRASFKSGTEGLPAFLLSLFRILGFFRRNRAGDRTSLLPSFDAL